MFDTIVAVVGNVLAVPEWRRIPSSGALVANFKIASTARRFDRELGKWVDGNSLRIRVVAWRRLAEGVASSVTVGDPVVVQGRLYTRDWNDEGGNHRVSYEMEAFAIGLDLARGRSRFFRHRAVEGASVIEDAEGETLVAGESAIPLTGEEVPVGYGDGVPDVPEPTFVDPGIPQPAYAGPAPQTGPEPDPAPEPGPDAEPKPGEDEELALEVERLVAEQPPTPRRNRRTRREPVAA